MNPVSENTFTFRRALRPLLSIAAALVISLSLFLLMQRLIHPQSASHQSPKGPIFVDTRAPKPEAPRQSAEAVPQAPKEPQLPDIRFPDAVPVAVEPQEAQVDAPDIDISLDVKQLTGEQNYWVQPSGEAGSKIEYLGEADTGIRDIVPAATTRPNIPKIAWDHKIDGWVLVAFSINADGDVGNVRIMNAHPRGVFEANAVAAVKGWRYMPPKDKRTRYISQRIEFKWKDYPMNIRAF
ncbi:Protein TonB [BD1-7 clade bacterium]|uniref:Protein TonB n=1 Tax=BD1-7 clade bacterium TaxID=2029982 RepID=A0A5S9NKK6_9GAMM|nr:Protein TonB [BD1-7 clade bacterium]